MSISRALELLAEAARAELRRHPQAHLAPGDGEVELSLTLPAGATTPSDAALAERARDIEAALRTGVESLIEQGAALRPGRVPNFRTGRADGDDTRPPDGRHVFAGWGPSGVPRFVDFGQWMLELGHPRQELLYRKPPGLVTAPISGDDLAHDLLPAFRDLASADTDGAQLAGYRLHGQVAAGWWRVPRADGTGTAVQALSFQAASVRAGTKRARRLTLQVVGTGPDGEPLEELAARMGGEVPWQAPVAWAQAALETIALGESWGRAAEKRIAGVLGGLARRLEQAARSRGRRTEHAEQRHRQGDRPTRMALADLERAEDDDVLVDRRRETLVVLGDRGRAHVWSPAGKLVTSIRTTPESVERKVRQERWRPATVDEVAELRRAVDDPGA